MRSPAGIPATALQTAHPPRLPRRVGPAARGGAVGRRADRGRGAGWNTSNRGRARARTLQQHRLSLQTGISKRRNEREGGLAGPDMRVLTLEAGLTVPERNRVGDGRAPTVKRDAVVPSPRPGRLVPGDHRAGVGQPQAGAHQRNRHPSRCRHRRLHARVGGRVGYRVVTEHPAVADTGALVGPLPRKSRGPDTSRSTAESVLSCTCPRCRRTVSPRCYI